MWWGGFSEKTFDSHKGINLGLNPHVVGRFFRDWRLTQSVHWTSLNPHVVGRVFRERRVVFFIKFKCLKWPISKLQIFTKINGD